jgi:hypothetical protein
LKTDPTWLIERRLLIDQLGLSIDTTPYEGEPRLPGFAWATVMVLGREFRMLIEDEYGDLEKQFLPLSLEVLLRSCLDFQDYSSASEWAHANALVDAGIDTGTIWQIGREVAQTLLPMAETVLNQISDLDWQLNSGQAFYLRETATA